MKRHAYGRGVFGLRAAGLLSAGTLLALGGGACAADVQADAARWPDTLVGRLEALTVLQTLNAELLSHDSATLTLEHWCDEHHLAAPARVVAERISADKAATAEQRGDLDVTDAEPIRYRHVRLSCGGVVLSEADNWYVPARLNEQMNQQLETTDTPFGKVVQPLHFRRHTVAAELLWQPLPAGWDMAKSTEAEALRAHPASAKARLVIPAEVLRHRAVLSLADGTPFSEVVETYTGAVLAFSP